MAYSDLRARGTDWLPALRLAADGGIGLHLPPAARGLVREAAFGRTPRKSLILWWAVLGSNQWPLPCESSALPLS